MVRLGTATNILMEMRKVFQHPYLVAPEMDNPDLPLEEQHKQLTDASGKLLFLKQLLPRLKARGHRVLLFSQFKIALDLIEDFLRGEDYKYLRLDGDVNQLHRQKDMDKFNAPGSDYFIFLLTTRAGGVGINLASADTVIVHDPDFNPHQDLQAISRAHRYGQNKRVLVFKLMMENSAEARIINSGKKKLVLDHLVVQQLGKEREEGDYENLILYGAEEITKADVDDESTTRHWTPQMIDELIDGAEREADEMARAQKVAEAARDAVVENGDDDSSKKKGFSFAKIWETKDKKLEAAPDEDEAEPEFDEHGWIEFLKKTEEAQEAERQKAMAVAGRLRAQKKKPKYTVVDDLDTTPKKKSKGRKKEAKRDAADDDAAERRDGDFVPPPADSSDEDEETGMYEDITELDDDQRALVGASGMVRRKLTNHERRLLKQFQDLGPEARKAAVAEAYKRRKAIQAAHQQAAVQAALARNAAHTNAHTNAAAGPGPSTVQHQQQGRQRRMSVEELSAQLGQQRPNANAPLVNAAHLHNIANQSFTPQHGVIPNIAHHPSLQAAAAAGAVSSQMARLPAVAPVPYQAASRSARFPKFAMMSGPVHLEHVKAGRDILNHLFRIVQRTMDLRLMNEWTQVANQRMHGDERKRLYLKLATIADDWAERQGGSTVFSKQVAVYTACYFIDSGLSTNDPQNTHTPVPAAATPLIHAPQPVQVSRNPPFGAVPQPHPHNAPTWQTAAGSSAPGHFAQGQGVLTGSVQGPPQQPSAPQPVAPLQSAPVQQHSPVPRPAPHVGTNRDTAISVPSTRAPSAQNGSVAPSVRGTPLQAEPSRTPSEYFDAGASPSVHSVGSRGPPTPVSRPHTPAAAPARISLSGAATTDSGAQPVASTNALQLGDSSRIPGATSAPTASQAAGTSCYWCQGPHPLRDCPQLLPAEQIDSFKAEIARSATTGEERAKGLEALEMMKAAHAEREAIALRAKAPRLSDSASTVPQKRRRSHGEALGPVGCPICMDEGTHTAAMCPVVKAGPESIREAMQRFEVNTPTHDVLSTLLRSQETGVPPGAMEVCAFCETTCGQRVRDCAEARGTRKQLKHKIRTIDAEAHPHVRKKLKLLKSKRVAAEEWEWNSIDRHIADANGEIARLEAQLAKLYEAYAEWPNPKPRPA